MLLIVCSKYFSPLKTTVMIEIFELLLIIFIDIPYCNLFLKISTSEAIILID